MTSWSHHKAHHVLYLLNQGIRSNKTLWKDSQAEEGKGDFVSPADSQELLPTLENQI